MSTFKLCVTSCVCDSCVSVYTMSFIYMTWLVCSRHQWIPAAHTQYIYPRAIGSKRLLLHRMPRKRCDILFSTEKPIERFRFQLISSEMCDEIDLFLHFCRIVSSSVCSFGYRFVHNSIAFAVAIRIVRQLPNIRFEINFFQFEYASVWLKGRRKMKNEIEKNNDDDEHTQSINTIEYRKSSPFSLLFHKFFCFVFLVSQIHIECDVNVRWCMTWHVRIVAVRLYSWSFAGMVCNNMQQTKSSCQMISCAHIRSLSFSHSRTLSLSFALLWMTWSEHVHFHIFPKWWQLPRWQSNLMENERAHREHKIESSFYELIYIKLTWSGTFIIEFKFYLSTKLDASHRRNRNDMQSNRLPVHVLMLSELSMCSRIAMSIQLPQNTSYIHRLLHAIKHVCIACVMLMHRRWGVDCTV